MNIKTHASVFKTLHESFIFSFGSNAVISISIDFITKEGIMKHEKSLDIIIICLAALFLAGCSKNENAVDSSMEAIAAKDYDTAVAIAGQAVEGGGGKLARRAKGIAHLARGEYEMAAQSFTDALACSNGLVDKTDIDVSYYLAVAQYKMGNIEDALGTCDAIIGIRPGDDGAYFLRGKIELALGNKEEAIASFDKTVELSPTDYDRYVGIYEELHARGYEDEASSYLEKAMSAGNKLSDYNKGVLEYYLLSYTDARNDLENAKKKGNSENLTLYLGKTYEALGDSSYAMSLYDEYLRQDPSAGRIYEQLATCKVKMEDYEGALETIDSGLSLGNGEGEAGLMFDRIVAYEMLYDFENAKKSMDEYLKLYPDDEVAKRENIFLSSR